MKKLLIINLIIILFSSVGFAQDCNENYEEYHIAGSSLTLDATREWDYPLTYTWFKNGDTLKSQTTGVIDFSNITIADNGYYKCERECNSWGAPEIICFDIFVNEQGTGSLEGEYPIEQFVVWYNENSDRTAIKEKLLEIGATKTRSCLCDLELWEVDKQNLSILQIEETVETARAELDEDETDSNYFLENPRPKYCISNNDQIQWSRINKTGNYQNPPIVGILDTGFDHQHPDINPYIWEYGANEPCCDGNDPTGYNAVDHCATIIDEQGHGTAVAGIIGTYLHADVESKLLNIKIINDQGGDLFNLICGGIFALKEGATVINMSFGYCGKKSKLMERFIEEANDRGVLLVTSAGNNGEGKNNHWPSRFSLEFDNIIAVGAADGNNNKTGFSGRADLYAPGHNLICAAPDNTKVLKSGTSMAAAFVTAAAATIRAEDRLLHPNEVIDLLKSSPWSSQDANGRRLLNVSTTPVDDNGNPIEFQDNVNITVPLFEVENIDAKNEITASSIISPQSVVHFRAGERIRLTSGFYAANSSTFRAKIETCHAEFSPLTRQNQNTTGLDAKSLEEVFEVDDREIFSALPNPFFENVTLRFSMEETDFVKLVIYNTLGQEITVLCNENKEKGVHILDFKARNLPPGLYYATLWIGNEMKTKKLVLSSQSS